METKNGKNLWSAGLWSDGREFIETAAAALAFYKKKNPTNPNGPGYASFAIYFNFLHGIELSLKSYLVHEVGMREKELRDPNKFGHNLDRLLDKALCHRLQCACTELEDIDIKAIRFLSEPYSSKKFEYIWMGGRLEMLNIDQVAKTANHLSSGLRDLVWTGMAQEWEAFSDSEKKKAKQEARRFLNLGPRRGKPWRESGGSCKAVPGEMAT